MKWLTLALCVIPFVMALREGTVLVSCPLVPTVGGAGSGLVACVFGYTQNNQSLFCGIQYANLQSDITGVKIRTTSTALPGNIVDFTQFITAGLNKRSDAFDGFVLENTAFVPAVGVTAPAKPAVTLPNNVYNTTYGDFKSTIIGCFDGSAGCVVSIQTGSTTALSCTLGDYLIYGASFEFPLNANLTVQPNSLASGYAHMDWFVTYADARSALSQSVWVYEIQYNHLSGSVTYAGLFNGLAPYPALTSLPATVGFDIFGNSQYSNVTTGSFVGVALQYSRLYNLDTASNYIFLSNCSQSLCYVGVETIIPGYEEIRGQLSGVGSLVPSLFALICALLCTFYY